MKNSFVFTSIPTVGTQALKWQRGERGAFLEVVGAVDTASKIMGQIHYFVFWEV